MTSTEEVTEGLNAEQRRAVELVRGPVVILAGAGSGKTTTITRRIANQVLSGAFEPTQILAVTFTKKAAEEMKKRLAALGVPGVPASTFHSAAQRQIGHFAGERRTVVANKLSLIYPIVNTLPPEHRKVAATDLASEIERARNNRVTPERYLSQLGRHDPPLPAEQMVRVYRSYEQAKRNAEVIDFEDQLELAIRLFETDDVAIAQFRDRYRAFTVDEFQDVNLLQWTLLSLWLGDHDELCAVGDDYQSIYGFSGATSRYLLSLAERFRNAAVITLEQNYRSTQEVLTHANRLAPHLGGRKKTLRAGDETGPAPTHDVFADYEEEAREIAKRCVELSRKGVPLREMAILYRVGFRSPIYEEALLAVRLPFEVHGGAFLERRAAKQLLARLRSRAAAVDVDATVAREAAAAGFVPESIDDAGPAEQARQADFARFVSLAELYAGSDETVGGFLAELERRFGGERDRDAVQLMTYHSAKGLEWEAVFLPRLEDRELPHWRAIKQGTEDEERRLLYVGITRAKRYLWLSSTLEGQRSRFVDELTGTRPPQSQPIGANSATGHGSGQTARTPRRARTHGAPRSADAKMAGGWVPEWMRDKKRKG